MRGPDQGVCVMIGDDCCTIIPMHTGPTGLLNALLTRMKEACDEMVSNNVPLDPEWFNWFDWLFSTDWVAGLVRIRTTILTVLLVIGFIVCCGIPCLRTLLDRTVHSPFGQYMRLHMQDMTGPDSSGPMAASQCPDAALPSGHCPHCHEVRLKTSPCGRLRRERQGTIRLEWAALQCAACCNMMSTLEVEHDDEDPNPRWRVFHPCCMDIDWKINVELARPAAKILARANFYYVEATWLAEKSSESFELHRGLTSTVETYLLHRSISVAQIYGSFTAHGFLISRNIVQSSMVSVVSVHFCGYFLWTSHSKGQLQHLSNLEPRPANFNVWKSKDSVAIATRACCCMNPLVNSL
ncbi:hypothetical protein QTP86_000678 [Hemibagrus guttatus]|nr:hypothetical protein QTP86_000678 [Hemibagrus guttatus]